MLETSDSFFFSGDGKIDQYIIPKQFQVILPTNMLASLEIYNSFVSGVYMDDKSDMIFQLQILRFWSKHVFNNNMILIVDIYVGITVYLLQLV